MKDHKKLEYAVGGIVGPPKMLDDGLPGIIPSSFKDSIDKLTMGFDFGEPGGDRTVVNFARCGKLLDNYEVLECQKAIIEQLEEKRGGEGYISESMPNLDR